MNNKNYISFITTVKICKNYEWLVDSIKLYIENITFFCHKHDIKYEILICEQVNEKNIMFLDESLAINNNNVKIIRLEQQYSNPFNYNLIESYGKNACLDQTNSEFVCMTSGDQIFSEEFFIYIKEKLKKKLFYRFATYEYKSDPIQSSLTPIEVLKYSKTNTTKLINYHCFKLNSNVDKQQIILSLGHKSGDVMLLDTESFKAIKGWPETPFFYHMDLAVCAIAFNNFSANIPPPNVCTFTPIHTRGDYDINSKEKALEKEDIVRQSMNYAISCFNRVSYPKVVQNIKER